jgi:hypothetical protein
LSWGGHCSQLTDGMKSRDRSVEDVTEEILSEAALPEVSDAEVDLQADRFDHARDLRKQFSRRPDASPSPATAQTKSTVDPVVLRAARSACAFAASFSG